MEARRRTIKSRRRYTFFAAELFSQHESDRQCHHDAASV
ncbi:hypothetical protein SbBS512_A0201 (plasmid) [Shigella boydii CDC 3083-94]|uniref:Uncharacterized protein n=1 Tax=Shigella boydii serotype 18 (strain CDC 3083-94 / BS512) TaxID=344609 RepID=B2TT15_SHIB3|nr:hypothetical protein SbBS512_A0201 [Shigella boydii CDC 3083-94]